MMKKRDRLDANKCCSSGFIVCDKQRLIRCCPWVWDTPLTPFHTRDFFCRWSHRHFDASRPCRQGTKNNCDWPTQWPWPQESKATKPKCARCHESSEDLSKRSGCGHLYCASCKKSSTCHVCQLMQDWKAKPESSRLAFVVDHLRNKRPKKSKSIVFSQWVAMLDLLHYLLNKTSGIRVFRIDGTVRDRGAVLDAFSAYAGDDKAVLLSSIQTSGVGLNITCADAVYHLDLWFHGNREDQADGRAHRIGQTKPVTSYRSTV
jgi:hypothetical protein